MRALLLKQLGSIDHLEWGEMPDKSPAAGQLLVRIKATSLNPADYKKALYNDPDRAYPIVLGLDAAGEIAAIGEGVTGFQLGDRVAALTSFGDNGAFAEYAVIDARAAALIPKELSYEQAAALMCAGMTAYEAIVQRLNTDGKETILIHAGAGGVGGYAIQLAKQKGLKVLTTASKLNHEWVKKLGADIVIDYNEEDVTERIRQETNGRGVDLILSTVNRDVATADLGRLAFAGQLAYIAGGPNMSDVKPFTLAPSVHEVALVAAYDYDRAAIANLSILASAIMQQAAEGRIDTLITETLEASQLVDGLRKLAQRHVRGKIAVRMF